MTNRKQKSFGGLYFNLIVLLILTGFFSVAGANDFGRNYSDTIPAAFQIDFNKLRDHIYAQIPDEIRNVKYKRESFSFADQNANRIAALIASGKIYTDWPSLEDYLNQVLQKVLPAELKSDSTIHAYVLKDGYYNAFMTPSGHMFVNLGIFSGVTDEASIAGIFAHELAHYYKKHSLNTYIESVKGTFDPSIFYKNKSWSKYSIKNELQADSLAIIWLYQSGYNLNGLYNAFEIIKRIEKNKIRQLQDKWELEETTHPTSEKRFKQFADFVQAHSNNQGKRFLVDEQRFHSLREQAKSEILNLLQSNLDNYTCLETAFRFHLYDPDNATYIYYILESIRRSCYLNSNLWTKLFITNRYYDDIPREQHRNKPEMKDHLFVKFDPDIIILSPGEESEMKATFYWTKQPKFTTYEEAYNFYYAVSQKLGCTECILSNALTYTRQDSVREKFLREYLGHDTILHRDYATNLLDGTIYKNLTNHKLVGFDNMDITIRQGEEDIPIVNRTPENKTMITVIIDSVMAEQKNKKAIFMDEFKWHHFKDYNLLMELEKFSLIATMGIGEKTELHILNPEYWEFFNRYKVNEIQFVNARYYEFYSSESSIEAYKRVVEEDMDSLLGQNKCTRYIYSLISSLREVPKSVMKVRHLSHDNKLPFKANGSREIMDNLKQQIVQEENLAADLDSGYKKNYYKIAGKTFY